MPLTFVTCWKCDGGGKIGAFSHYVGGVCFECGGTGTRESRGAGHEGDPELVAAARELSERRGAWIASFSAAVPELVAARFAGLPVDKLHEIRAWCAGNDAPGARVAYWAACKVLGAWPAGRPYPVEWVYAA